MYFCLILKHTNSQSNSFADTCWSFAVSATKVLGSQHFCSFSMKNPNSWITASFSPDTADSRSGSRSTCKTWTKLDLIRLNIKYNLQNLNNKKYFMPGHTIVTLRLQSGQSCVVKSIHLFLIHQDPQNHCNNSLKQFYKDSQSNSFALYLYNVFVRQVLQVCS